MRILTVRQPWAQMIIEGHKAVENRVRNIAGDYRGPVAIHAGLAIDSAACFDPRVKDARDGNPFGGAVATGVILGVVNLWAAHLHNGTAGRTCCPNAPRYTRWAESDVWHLCLSNPQPLVEPISYRGALGLRKLEVDMVARIEAAIA